METFRLSPAFVPGVLQTNMIDLETAKRIVERRVNESWTAKGQAANHGPLVVVKHIEKPYGWVFFYTAKKYLETKDIKHAVAGNGPIIFDQRSGAMHQLGTATPPDEQIRDWEAEHLSRDE